MLFVKGLLIALIAAGVVWMLKALFPGNPHLQGGRSNNQYTPSYNGVRTDENGVAVNPGTGAPTVSGREYGPDVMGNSYGDNGMDNFMD